MPPTHLFSFGYKHGLPSIANPASVIDVRKYLTRNPYYEKRLRYLRGDHPDVQAEIMGYPGIDASIATLRTMIANHDGPVYLGCTGGHHRSVFLAILFGKEFNVPVTHLNYGDK